MNYSARRRYTSRRFPCGCQRLIQLSSSFQCRTESARRRQSKSLSIELVCYLCLQLCRRGACNFPRPPHLRRRFAIYCLICLMSSRQDRSVCSPPSKRGRADFASLRRNILRRYRSDSLPSLGSRKGRDLSCRQGRIVGSLHCRGSVPRDLKWRVRFLYSMYCSGRCSQSPLLVVPYRPPASH